MQHASVDMAESTTVGPCFIHMKGPGPVVLLIFKSTFPADRPWYAITLHSLSSLSSLSLSLRFRSCQQETPCRHARATLEQ